MTLTQKTTIGIIWNFTDQLAKKGIGVVITLLLARFLVPADFGLVAMMAVFLAVATSLMDSGLRQALIRLQNAEQVDFSTAFYANLCLGLLAYIVLFAVAPLISAFYEEPRLTILIRVSALGVLINAFQVVQVALLSRAINFKLQLQASIPAGIMSGIVAVFMAYAGFGVWALVVQMLLAAFVTTVLLWIFHGWRPTLSFSFRSLGSMYNFGYKLFLSGLLETVFQNLYVIVIAKLFTATVAGHYFFAKKITEVIINQLVGSIQRVTYPALSTLQNDHIRLKNGYRKVISVTTFLLFPSMLLLAALAESLFSFLLPDKWAPAAVYLQLMCIAGVMYPLHAINLNILQVKGRSDLFLYLEIIKKVMAVIILFISYRYGVIGILIGQIIGSIIAYIPNSYFSAKLINYPVREQMADFVPGLVLSGVVAFFIYGTSYLIHWPDIAKLLVLGVLASGSYLVGAHALKLEAYLMARQMLVARMNGSL